MIEKSESAFRTIGELSSEIGVPQHILRYWETRFPELKPLTRAGSRRYYRIEDVALVRRIHNLLYAEGYTVKGVQKLLADKHTSATMDAGPAQQAAASLERQNIDTAPLVAIRDRLAQALEQTT